MKKKRNAIIVLNYNDSTTVINYINLIKDYKSIDRIVIVDNCSPDGSYDILKEYENDKIVVIKTEANKGYAYGNNYGVKYLDQEKEQYDFITISNPDIDITDETIDKCLNFLDKHKDIVMTSPTMYMLDGSKSLLRAWKERKLDSDLRDSSAWLTKKNDKEHKEIYEEDYFKGEYSYVDCIPGSFFIIKYKAFNDVGYFDENTFLYYEEDILGKKLKNKGYKAAILNDLKFTHFESVSINKSFNKVSKYKIIQKSKKYYHEHYNEECINNKKNVKKFKWATFVGVCEILFKKTIFYKLYEHIKYDGFILFFLKIFIYALIIILLPFRYLARKMRKRKKVCYFSLVTWKWIKQRPHFVALKLSEKYKVDYLYLDLKDKYKNEHNTVNALVSNDVNSKYLKIKPYYIYPGDNKYRLRRGLSYLKIILLNYDAFIYTQPNQIETIFPKALKFNKTKIYYECMDNYIGWEQNKRYFEQKEIQVINCSQKIFVSSLKLLDYISDKYGISKDKFILVRNGYDATLFNSYKSKKVDLKRPCATYIGTIDNWFDLKNILAYAKSHKDFYFNIVGPINPSIKDEMDKIKLKNVIIHGPIEHSMVPSYIENSDIMLMPFIINDIIEYVDPVKVYEYLYFKKNIVSSYWKELDQFNGLMYYYHNDAEFETAMDQAIKNKFKENKQFKEIIEDSKWDNRLQIYLDTLEGNK